MTAASRRTSRRDTAARGPRSNEGTRGSASWKAGRHRGGRAAPAEPSRSASAKLRSSESEGSASGPREEHHQVSRNLTLWFNRASPTDPHGKHSKQRRTRSRHSSRSERHLLRPEPAHRGNRPATVSGHPRADRESTLRPASTHERGGSRTPDHAGKRSRDPTRNDEASGGRTQSGTLPRVGCQILRKGHPGIRRALRDPGCRLGG